MTQVQGVSQLTLIKTLSNQDKCLVHVHVDSLSHKWELQIDDSTSVENVILKTVILLNKASDIREYDAEEFVFELYAAKKNGRPFSDLPSLEPQQKILLTGIKFFHLSVLPRDIKLRNKLSSVSTKSIQS